MSRFYTEINTERGSRITRTGSRSLSTHTRTWNKGVRVECSVNEDGSNNIKVYETRGSNHPHNINLIYEINE